MFKDLRKIYAIALNTFRETIRDRILYSLIVFVIFVLLMACVLGSLSVGQDERILKDIGLAAIGFIGGIIAVFAGCNLVYKEIDKKTIYIIFTKPITGWQFIIGKYLGLCVAVWLSILLMGAFLIAALTMFGTGSFAHQLTSLSLPLLLVQLEIFLVVAIAIFFSTFATPIMSVLFTLSLWLIAHFGDSLKELALMSPTPAIKTISNTLYYVLPDLANLTRARSHLMYGNQGNSDVVIFITCYIISYALILLVMASIITEKREFS